MAENKIYLLNTYSKTLKTVTDTGDQTDAVFSPDSNHILYNSGDAELNLIDKDGSNKVDLKIKANLKTVAWTKDSKNIIIATTDPSTKAQSVFQFDTEKVVESGFSIKNLGNSPIRSIALTDDGKLLLYEVGGQIYALKVE